MWTPGILKWFGERWLKIELDRLRGDADVLGLAKSDDGWEFIPCNIESDGGEMHLVPVDGDERPFPAEGVPEQPPRLYGCPIAIGYKHFGALAEIPNVDIARDVMIDLRTQALDAENTVDGKDTEPPGYLERVHGWLGDKRDAIGAWRSGVRFKWGWNLTQGRADALIIEEDGDNAVVMERANFTAGQDEPDWFVSSCGYRFDARGNGAPPTEAGPADVGMAYAPIPRLVAPSLCRLARNMREVKIEDGAYQYGGRTLDSTTGEPMTDGGTALGDGIPEPKVAQPDEGAIEVEERAFVDPEDVKLLGGAQETQDKIETLLKQTEAKENTPGSSLAANLVDFGKILIAFAVGAVLGGGGGGSGGGGSMIPLSLIPDPTALQPALEVMSLVGL